MSTVTALLSSSMDPSSTSSSSSWKARTIPTSPLIIGYAHNSNSKSSTTNKVEESIQMGVNVICWSFLDMSSDQNKKAAFKTDLDMQGIKSIRNKYKHVLHIAAIGGWNGPHPPSGTSGKEWCELFMELNQDNGNIFDGIDWDLEGHDDRNGPTSKFTMETLDIMAEMSMACKQKHGLLVSLAPAESYLDALDNSNKFSLDLNLPPSSYMESEDDRKKVEDAGFSHAGMQCYAYVLHKANIDTFDWISLQLYEAYSRFLHDTTRQQKTTKLSSEVDALMMRAEALHNGYNVDIPHYGISLIKVPFSKLVFGIANGWADGNKFCKIDPSSLGIVWEKLHRKYGEGYRGAMFWTIEEEGTDGIYMSSLLSNVFLRSDPTSDHHVTEL